MGERITREFCGRSLHEVRRRLLEAMAQEKAAYDRILARTLALGSRALEGSESQEQIYVDGAAQLLEKPEFADVDSLKKVFRAFEEKARLLDLMTRYLDSRRTCVVLGSEQPLTADPRLSAVLTSYGVGETLSGMLGVIGRRAASIRGSSRSSSFSGARSRSGWSAARPRTGRTPR
jgi:heat-inducible transcriptional repressor